uniref:Putative ATP-binding protein n=1 Tax=Candidatus Methanogaster sp. ANME-2c ERB4 TaxID=2759911 RepID=A0A7G9YF23_9EURY|nr:putative ATP-binding protein [Methanosarcinales archaeon ANME-2c ERB4]
MKRIEFHDREPETKEIRDILDAEPSLITFIYGPINSGKTALINHLVDRLPDDYKVFYINLRGRFISNYDDFVKVLFDVEHVARYERIKEFLKPIAAVLPESYNGIPIPKDTFLKLFKEKEIEDVFVYIETVLRVFYESGRVPVLVIDELQVIGDMKIDGHLIYKLFNFFVRLTKELHLAHVFVVTSDSLFLEQVYSEAMLSGRCEYLRVDDFEYEQTMTFLDGYGWGEQEKEIAWRNVGGKPVSLVKLINAKVSGKNIEDVISSMFTLRTGEIATRLKIVKELGDEMVIGDKHFDVHHGKLVSILKMFASRDEVGADEIDEISKRYLVKENILFVDPLTKMIKPQSQLDLLAIRDVMA